MICWDVGELTFYLLIFLITAIFCLAAGAILNRIYRDKR